MSNKDLLKQAIAEAKTVREAAIANAKEALEESLTPHLKEMLAQKLQEMENDELEEGEGTINQAEFEDYSDDPAKHGNVGNLNEEEEEEAEEEEEEEVEAEEAEEDEDIKIEDMSVEELKDLIRDIVAQETGEEAEEVEDLEADDMTGMEDEEEIDINELLAELDEMDKKEVKEGQIEEVAEYIEGARELVEMFPFLNLQTASLVIGALGAAGLAGFSAITAKVMDMALAGKFGSGAKSFAEKLQAAGGAAAKAVQNREGVEEGIKGMKGMKEMSYEPENIDEDIDVIYELIQMFPFLTNKTAELLLGVFGSMGIFGLSAIASKIHQMANNGDFGEKGKQIGAKLSKLGKDAAGVTQQREGAEEELTEALETIEELRTQLQEVNLLNAKLLYVNKVFKANNLTESQKVNVVAAFDKAETVKEVKLVFETVSKNVVTKQPARVAIKEHTSFASRPAGSTQKQVINEVSEAVTRMQILAGIKPREY